MGEKCGATRWAWLWGWNCAEAAISHKQVAFLGLLLGGFPGKALAALEGPHCPQPYAPCPLPQPCCQGHHPAMSLSATSTHLLNPGAESTHGVCAVTVPARSCCAGEPQENPQPSPASAKSVLKLSAGAGTLSRDGAHPT